MTRGVLFVSPHPEDAEVLSRMLNPLNMVVEHAENLGEARSSLQRKRFGVVLTEATLPDGCWMDVLDLTRQLEAPSELIVTHPFADSRFWAEALSLGAYDLVVQPFSEPEVRRIFSNACSRPQEKMAWATG